MLAGSLFLVACGGDDNDSGGSTNTGGATNSGGSTSTGGSTGETGGGTSTGGSTGETGGSTSTGGSSTGTGGSSAGDARFACMVEGDGSYSTCIEYSGSASSIETIRDASGCTDQGGTELDACPTEDAGICTVSLGEMSSSTYYYGFSADDVEAYTAICEATGGTFTAP